MDNSTSTMQITLANQSPRSQAPLTASSLVRLNSELNLVRSNSDENSTLSPTLYPVPGSPRSENKPLNPQTSDAVIYDMSSFQIPPNSQKYEQSTIPENVLQASANGVGIRNEIVAGGSGPFYFTAMTINPIHGDSPPPSQQFKNSSEEGAPPPPPIVAAPRGSIVPLPSGDDVPPPPFSS